MTDSPTFSVPQVTRRSKGSVGGGGVVEEDDVGLAVVAEDGKGFCVGGPAEVDDLVGLERSDGVGFGAVQRLHPDVVGTMVFGDEGNGFSVRGEVHSEIVRHSHRPENETVAGLKIEHAHALFGAAGQVN